MEIDIKILPSACFVVYGHHDIFPQEFTLHWNGESISEGYHYINHISMSALRDGYFLELSQIIPG